MYTDWIAAVLAVMSGRSGCEVKFNMYNKGAALASASPTFNSNRVCPAFIKVLTEASIVTVSSFRLDKSRDTLVGISRLIWYLDSTCTPRHLSFRISGS